MSIYQVVAKQIWLAQEIRNVFYYTTTSALSSSQFQELVDKVRLSWSTMAASGSLADNWQLYGCTVRDVSSGGLDGIEWSFSSGPLVGVSADDSLPTQVALLSIGRSGTTKPKQVRSYLGGMTEGWIANAGVWTAAYLGYVHDWAVDMDTLSLTGDTAYRVAAQWTSPPNPYVDSTNVLVSYAETAVPATQKRRRIGIGI